MTDPGRDPRRERGGGTVAPSEGPQEREAQSQSSKTAGTNRDFDETGESSNQGHGHPREEREVGRD